MSVQWFLFTGQTECGGGANYVTIDRGYYQSGAEIDNFLKDSACFTMHLLKAGTKSVWKEIACASAKMMDDMINENAPFRWVVGQQVRESACGAKRIAAHK